MFISGSCRCLFGVPVDVRIGEHLLAVDVAEPAGRRLEAGLQPERRLVEARGSSQLALGRVQVAHGEVEPDDLGRRLERQVVGEDGAVRQTALVQHVRQAQEADVLQRQPPRRLQEGTRKHSSRMNTDRLPTVLVSVATTRCQYQLRVGVGIQVNKYEQVSSDGHQTSQAGECPGPMFEEVPYRVSYSMVHLMVPIYNGLTLKQND